MPCITSSFHTISPLGEALSTYAHLATVPSARHLVQPNSPPRRFSHRWRSEVGSAALGRVATLGQNGGTASSVSARRLDLRRVRSNHGSRVPIHYNVVLASGRPCGAATVTVAIGATVVYPVHGVAEVVGRETRTFAGETQPCLVLLILGDHRADDLRVLVREDRLEQIGVRPAMSQADATDVLAVLAVRDPRLSPNWSRRFKNHQAKLKSGDVFEVAEVVRNLTLRQQIKSLSAAEKAMYRQARTTLVSELAVTWDITTDAASDRVDDALQP